MSEHQDVKDVISTYVSTSAIGPEYPADVTPPRKSWSTKRKLVTWISVGFAGLLTLGGISSAVSPSHPAASHKPVASAPAAPKVTQAPAPKVTPTQAPAPVAPALTQSEQITAWYAGEGGSNFNAVQSDLTTMASDADKQDLAAVQADGSKLSADSRAAAATPIPVASAKYVQAMNYYATAGADAASGDITGATSALPLGTALINQVTAAVKAVDGQ